VHRGQSAGVQVEGQGHKQSLIHQLIHKMLEVSYGLNEKFAITARAYARLSTRRTGINALASIGYLCIL
jgi:hypothetical protein